jgi:hypothetical protein
MTTAMTKCALSWAALDCALPPSISSTRWNKNRKKMMSPWNEYHCVNPSKCLVKPRMACTNLGFHQTDSMLAKNAPLISFSGGGRNATSHARLVTASVGQLLSSGSYMPSSRLFSAPETSFRCHNIWNTSPPHQSPRPRLLAQSSNVVRSTRVVLLRLFSTIRRRWSVFAVYPAWRIWPSTLSAQSSQTWGYRSSKPLRKR